MCGFDADFSQPSWNTVCKMFFNILWFDIGRFLEWRNYDAK